MSEGVEEGVAGITAQQIGWIAGILEGEGCFIVRPIQLRLQMTDRDVVEKIANLLSAKMTKNRKLRSRKQLYGLYIGGKKAAAVMMSIFSFMGQRRRKRIREALMRWNRRPVRYADQLLCSRGHQFARIPSHWKHNRGRRYCPQCKKVSNKRYDSRRRFSNVVTHLDNQQHLFEKGGAH